MGHQQGMETMKEYRQWLQSIEEKLRMCEIYKGDKKSLETKSLIIEELEGPIKLGNVKRNDIKKMIDSIRDTLKDDKSSKEFTAAMNLSSEWDDLSNRFEFTKDNIQKVLKKWNDYNETCDRFSHILNALEMKIHNFSTPRASLSEKEALKKELLLAANELKENEYILDNIFQLSGDLYDISEVQSVPNAATKLKMRYDALLNSIDKLDESIIFNIENHKNYQNFLDDCKYWIDKSQQRIENIEIDPNDSEKLKETKLILEDAKSQLVDMKEKIESCEELANKLNKSTSLIGQDEIQSEIKSLYEFYENYMDILHEHNKNINYLLDSREMYFEHKNQLENWIHNMKIKLNKIDLDNTLEEKRINYLLNKSLVQEIKANEHAVNSLQNKGKPVNNYDYEKDNELLKSEYDTLLHQANVHMDVSEKVYEDHMDYNT